MANPSIASNRTRSILHAAKEGKYAVGGYNWYARHILQVNTSLKSAYADTVEPYAAIIVTV